MMMGLSNSEIIESVIEGNRHEILQVAFGVKLTFIVSYVSQIGKFRIDTRVDDVMVNRAHYDTTAELIQRLNVIR